MRELCLTVKCGRNNGRGDCLEVGTGGEPGAKSSIGGKCWEPVLVGEGEIVRRRKESVSRIMRLIEGDEVRLVEEGDSEVSIVCLLGPHSPDSDMVELKRKTLQAVL